MVFRCAGRVMLVVVLSAVQSARPCERVGPCPGLSASHLSSERMTAIEVELDVFAGMPNPTWTLSETDADVLLSKLSELKKTTARPRSTKLGYRGIVVRVSQEPRREIYIQDGVVETIDQSSSTFFVDPQRSLERWLVETGKKFLSPEPLEVIERDLRK